jgi:tetratricopeptide (TPR) repeat protein/SAM-dependent methyltransferase
MDTFTGQIRWAGVSLTRQCWFASTPNNLHSITNNTMNREPRRTSEPPGNEVASASIAGASPGQTVAKLFATAVARHQAGVIGEAESRYRQVLKLFPEHADSLHNLGLIALQRGSLTDAVDLIEKAIKVNDRVAEYHYNIAGAWRALNRMEEVAAHLERAIELRGDHALAHLNLGNVRLDQGDSAAAVTCYERALALDPNLSPAYFNLANIQFKQGRWNEAIAGYRNALARGPCPPEIYHRLGMALLAQRKTDDAIYNLERAVALKPDSPDVYSNLAKAYARAARFDLVVPTAARALELNETPETRTLFAQYVKFTRFTADDSGRFRRLVLRALTGGWSRPRELANVCVNLIKLNGSISDCVARANAAWPERLPAAELFGPSGLSALSNDELLICLLECDPVADIGMERLLASARHAMLLLAAGDEIVDDEQHLRFFAALAAQCFINEYVYALTEAEAKLAANLQSRLTKALTEGASIPALWPIALAAHVPLHAVAGTDTLLTRRWPAYLDALLTQQIKDPAEQRNAALAIPVLTALGDEVSHAVRRQYEENPYPRWVKPGPPVQFLPTGDPGRELFADILIAGCGTGLSAVEIAGYARDSRILAIDLSLASLSYAKCKAERFGLANIEFAQADIMRLSLLARQFDFVDASGVLHHLADPWQGWQILLSLLRPGGAMRVGLYSEMARLNVVEARSLIAERAYRPLVEDIRRCREEIMAAEDGSLLKSVTQTGDFFATSECRDLLFHVQEHRITLPEIKRFLDANNVRLIGFVLDGPVLQQFTKRYPDQASMSDLDCWDAFEAEFPNTFAGMYQFLVRKLAG